MTTILLEAIAITLAIVYAWWWLLHLWIWLATRPLPGLTERAAIWFRSKMPRKTQTQTQTPKGGPYR